MEKAQTGDTVRTRLFVTPILVQFTSLLLISMATVGPISAATLAFALGAIGLGGLFYSANLALISRQRADPAEHELLWDILLPIGSYVLVAAAAAAWALEAFFADDIGAVAVTVLLITALRNSWAVTLTIAGRKPK
jgi:uncharacterized membrane protein